MTWLKRLAHYGVTIALAIGTVLALMAASRERARAREWEGKAVGENEAQVAEDTAAAQAALGRAEWHDQRAEERIKKGEARLDELAKRDETVADIVGRWNPDRLRDKPAG